MSLSALNDWVASAVLSSITVVEEWSDTAAERWRKIKGYRVYEERFWAVLFVW